MKKTTAILLTAALFGAATLSIAGTASDSQSNSTEATVAMHAFDVAADRAISEGYLTPAQKQDIKRSRIVQQSVDAFVTSGYDPAAAIDKAAEVAVAQGWFKSKQSAKQYLRRELEIARRNQSLANKVYRVLGL